MENINEAEDYEALAQRLIAEEMARHAMRPVKAHHALATPGSKTRMGGEVVTGSAEFNGIAIACVGDTIRYPDGSESRILTGADMLKSDGRSIAVVGSTADNGDTIVDSRQSSMQITEFVGEDIFGLSKPGKA